MNLRQKVVSILRKKKTEEEIVEEEVLDKEITLDDLTNYISNRIVGQEAAIKTLISNILFNQFLIDELEEKGEIDYTELEARKISMLLEGPTGTGKSAIINDIAAKLAIPTCIINITKFFENENTSSAILYDLLLKADGNLDQAERGIIVVDEIDKIANNSDYSTMDDRKYIQEEVIALMKGDTYEFTVEQKDGTSIEIPFDTRKLTFIMCGNFARLKEVKSNDNGMINIIGFNTEDQHDKVTAFTKHYANGSTIPDLFTKIKVIANTKKYDIEDFERILKQSEISPLTSLVKTIKKFDYENVEYDEGLVSKLATDAYDMGVGAKGLQKLVSEAQNKVLYDIMAQKYDKNETIYLTKELLEPGKQRVRKL